MVSDTPVALQRASSLLVTRTYDNVVVMLSARFIILALALAIFSVPAFAEPISPPPAEKPIAVDVGIYVVDVSNISEVNNAFSVELDVVAKWTDVRHAFDADEAGTDHKTWFGPAAEQMRQSMWNAQVTAINTVGGLQLGQTNLTVDTDGNVMLRARVAATLRANLDYHRFPFDEQSLPIRLESYLWDAKTVILRPIENQTGFDPGFELAEWVVTGVRTEVSERVRPGYGIAYSHASFEIDIKRKSGYYVWKILLPLIVIVLISWVVFYMGDEGLGRRAGVSATGILTVIAYMFIATQSLPKVPYLTSMDKMMLLSIVTIGATMVVNIIVGRLASLDKQRAHRLDLLCRWAFPVFYFGSLLVMVTTSFA